MHRECIDAVARRASDPRVLDPIGRLPRRIGQGVHVASGEEPIEAPGMGGPGAAIAKHDCDAPDPVRVARVGHGTAHRFHARASP